jgi:hypothetical protein
MGMTLDDMLKVLAKDIDYHNDQATCWADEIGLNHENAEVYAKDHREIAEGMQATRDELIRLTAPCGGEGER